MPPCDSKPSSNASDMSVIYHGSSLAQNRFGCSPYRLGLLGGLRDEEEGHELGVKIFNLVCECDFYLWLGAGAAGGGPGGGERWKRKPRWRSGSRGRNGYFHRAPQAFPPSMENKTGVRHLASWRTLILLGLRKLVRIVAKATNRRTLTGIRCA